MSQLVKEIALCMFFGLLMPVPNTFAEGNPHFAQAKKMIKQGAYNQALSLFKKSLKIDLEFNGRNHITVAGDYFEIAKLLDRKAFRSSFGYDYKLSDKALENYKNALAIYIEQRGSESKEVGNIYWWMGSLFDNRQEFKDAIAYKIKSINITKEQPALDKRHLSFLYDTLGASYQKNQDHDLAIKYFEKSLEIELKHNDSSYPPLVSIYMRLGDSYTAISKYKKAIKYYERALKILKKTRPGHPYIQLIEQKLSIIKK